MLMSEYVEACDRALDLEDTDKVCSYCDTRVVGIVCGECGEYDGIISLIEWEDINGEVWED